MPGTELPRGGHGTRHYQVFDPTDRHLLMEFDASDVVDATATELVVASPWTEIPTEPFVSRVVQLYILDVTTDYAKWTGFAHASTPNFNLSANANHIVWTNNYCSEDALIEVVILERLSGNVLGWADSEDPRLKPGADDPWMFLTPSGLIAQGTFGATALIDPATRKYVAVLPPVQLVAALQSSGPVQPTWSNDYRYAAYWQGGGHGGLC